MTPWCWVMAELGRDLWGCHGEQAQGKLRGTPKGWQHSLPDRDTPGMSVAQTHRARRTWTERRAKNRTGAGGCFLASTTTVSPTSFASRLSPFFTSCLVR